jgi:hypothetical protein
VAVRQVRSALSRRDRAGMSALALYATLAFLLFGLRLVTDTGSTYSGTGRDPQIFIWAFAWWPHTILHGLNPFVTHAVWAPDGINLAWTTTVPGLALLFAPLTLAAGPVASYNVAAVLMPALAAWTAFLLCRDLTRRMWPSLVGGYLFGFSSYMLGEQLGHIHATSAFLVPLVALVVLRYVRGDLSGWALVARLAPLLALQLLFATEFAFTLTLAVACALVIGAAVAPALRARLVTSLVPLTGSYLLAGVLTSPFLYYLLSGFHSSSYHSETYNTDLLNFVVPTQLTLSGQGWAGQISQYFPGNISERGAYLGVPTLAIVALYAWKRARTAGGRFLIASFVLAVLAALGSNVVVDGHSSLRLPWTAVEHLPLFDNVLPERFTLYVSLAAALIVALWTASCARGVLQWLLPALAILAIVPHPAAGTWVTHYAVPPFFSDSSYRGCLSPGENILPLPPTFDGDADLWQVESGFRFTMAGGYIAVGPPASFLTPDAVAWIARGNPVRPDQVQMLVTYIHDKRVTSVVVDKSQRLWAAVVDRIAAPHDVGGVLLYHVAGPGPSCP